MENAVHISMQESHNNKPSTLISYTNVCDISMALMYI